MVHGQSDLSIGALSGLTDCNIETIRYYEKIGLMPAPPRSAGGHRQYDEGHAQRLGFIRRSRELGFSLDEIRALLNLADDAGYDCGTVRDITYRHLQSVRSKSRDLRRMERTTKTIAGECEGGTAPHCPIIETLYAAPGKAHQGAT